MKQLQQYPHPERPQNPSPLEMAIYNYELKAKDFHNKRIAQKGQASEELKNKMARDFNHLQKEKERITGISLDGSKAPHSGIAAKSEKT